jgi:V8-like Glu-specific endopeptidase
MVNQEQYVYGEKVYTMKDIYPIFTLDESTGTPLTFEGTGFVIADNLFVTCWHCVQQKLSPNVKYAAIAKQEHEEYKGFTFFEVHQDVNGKDLATARVNLKKLNDLKIDGSLRPMGTNVLTYGFPFTHRQKAGDRDFFDLQGRYLEGYVTREIYFNRRGWGIVPSYELFMPCPRGISGAPVIRMQSTDIIGVIYGTNDVSLIEELASIDPDTGDKTPEIQRIVSFGLAHFGMELYNLITPHTNNLPLGDFLKTKT